MVIVRVRAQDSEVAQGCSPFLKYSIEYELGKTEERRSLLETNPDKVSCVWVGDIYKHANQTTVCKRKELEIKLFILPVTNSRLSFLPRIPERS